MAKRKQNKSALAQHRGSKGFGTVPLKASLQRIDAAIAREDWDLAYSLLREADQLHPNTPEVLERLIGVCYFLDEITAQRKAAVELLRLRPTDGDAMLVLAERYLNVPANLLAAEAMEAFLAAHPHHRGAEHSRRMLADLREGIEAEYGDKPEKRARWYVQEQVQTALFYDGLAAAEAIAAPLIESDPTFVSPRNTLALGQWLYGDPQVAIAQSEAALAIDPQHIFTLSNLATFHLRLGNFAVAEEYRDRLLKIPTSTTNEATKVIETLAYWGEWQEVLTRVEALDSKAKAQDSNTLDGMTYHLGAVAAAELGHEAQARDWWRQCLEFDSSFTLALENLEVLKEEASDRPSPWAFSLPNWLSNFHRNKLLDAVDEDSDRVLNQRQEEEENEGSSDIALRQFFTEYEGIAKLLAWAFDRLSPNDQNFLASFEFLYALPVFAEAFERFARGQRGTNEQRLEIAQKFVAEGIWPVGRHRLWLGGQWLDIPLFRVKLVEDTEPEDLEQVSILQNEAAEAEMAGDAQTALERLEQAVTLEPDNGRLRAIYADKLHRAGQTETARDILAQLLAADADNLQAKLTLANLEASQNNRETAQALLDSLLTRETWTWNDLSGYFFTMAVFTLRAHSEETEDLPPEEDVKQGKEAAWEFYSWLTFWQVTLPEDPLLGFVTRLFQQSAQD